jgi:HAD superfamily hydrolase (TIGR01490 family)
MTKPSPGHPAAPQAKLRLALFDLDHTLIPFDSDHSWGEFSSQVLGWGDPEERRRRNDAFYEQYKAGTLDIHAYCRFAMQDVCVRGEQAASEAHARFMREVVQPGLQPQAVELVRRHQQAGDTVIIITATNEFVTRPIATAFGVQELVAVELERDNQPGGSGWYTGTIRGVPSFREGKVTRMAQWLAERGLDWASVHTTFYTDSFNDIPLMEQADVPVATNPDDRLRALATERGWRILELFA